MNRGDWWFLWGAYLLVVVLLITLLWNHATQG